MWSLEENGEERVLEGKVGWWRRVFGLLGGVLEGSDRFCSCRLVVWGENGRFGGAFLLEVGEDGELLLLDEVNEDMTLLAADGELTDTVGELGTQGEFMDSRLLTRGI